MKGWVGLVGWPVADGLPTIVVTHQLQVERRTGKVRRRSTTVPRHQLSVQSAMRLLLLRGRRCHGSRSDLSLHPCYHIGIRALVYKLRPNNWAVGDCEWKTCRSVLAHDLVKCQDSAGVRSYHHVGRMQKLFCEINRYSRFILPVIWASS